MIPLTQTSRVSKASALNPEHARKFNFEYAIGSNKFQDLMNGAISNS